MIGIKVQNQIWEKALLDLLGSEAEKYHTDHAYDLLVTDKKNENEHALILGEDITLPFRLETFQNKLLQFQEPSFENNTFKWLSKTRQVIRKKDKKIIQLTEKESEIIAFLAQKTNHKATREEILQAVWHYQNDIHTHTLESHIYTLRQKLTPYADKFILAKDGSYNLT